MNYPVKQLFFVTARLIMELIGLKDE